MEPVNINKFLNLSDINLQRMIVLSIIFKTKYCYNHNKITCNQFYSVDNSFIYSLILTLQNKG